MKRLFFVILAAALAWSGYWVFAQQQLKGTYEGWFADRRAEGWQAEYSDLTVQGYPNRLDTTFTDLAIADPETGWSWQAPYFQFLALSYRPTTVIAVFPPESTIRTPETSFTLTAEDLKASMTLSPAPRLPLDHVAFIGRDIAVAGEERLQMAGLRLAAERLPGAEAGYRVGARAEDVALPDRLFERLTEGTVLPELISRLHVDMDVEFDRPWDLDAIEDVRPQPRHVRLRLAQAVWGALDLSATGELQIDEAGLPEGEIAFKAEKWREMLDVAVAAGALSEAMASTAEQALSLLANLSGRPDTLEATLRFEGGTIYLGPVPIGAAPVLRLR